MTCDMMHMLVPVASVKLLSIPEWPERMVRRLSS